MKFNLSFPFKPSKEPRQLFKVDREFSTRTRITKRTVAIGEAFGIGVDEAKRFRVFKNFQVEIKSGQVVYITGDSGSGKSILLNQIIEQARCSNEFGKNIADNSSLKVDENEILVESVGSDVGEAISILSMAGLNEAFLMLRRYKELSDGQKYRYRIAKMIDSAAGLWAFDEFCAILDRTTAMAVSYTIQKTARKLGKTLVVATTHEDLLRDLKPDIWIRKLFGERVEVRNYNDPLEEFGSRCSLLDRIKIEKCGLEEIRELEQFHYRGGFVGATRACFKATLDQELVVAGIVYVYPHFSLKARNIALPEYKMKKPYGESLQKLNRDICRIARVIVIPKFRSIGLGCEIVKGTMPLVGTKYVETLAVMAQYNPFFEKAGMRKVPLPGDEKFERDLVQLESLGFRRELLVSKKHTKKILDRISSLSKLEQIATFALKHCIAEKYRRPELIPKVRSLDKNALSEALQLLRSKAIYLYWQKAN
jgi:ABC-type lipoprotein export system ATPase subunit